MPRPTLVTPSRSEDIANYYALCERAWLHWSRAALDFVTTHSLGQRATGTYKPGQISDARTAAEAHMRCAVHWRLLDAVASRHDEPEWGWRLEAARNVHAATGQALAIAAATDPADPPGVADLTSGIRSASEALVTAITAQFVTDATLELHETVTGMFGVEAMSLRRVAEADPFDADE